MIKERIETISFKSPECEEIATVLVKYLDEFESRGKGYVFKGLVLALGDVFPEDNLELSQLFTVDPVKAKAESGSGPKISRGFVGGASTVVPCDGCPDSATSDAPISPKGTTLKMSEFLNKGKENPDDNSGDPAPSGKITKPQSPRDAFSSVEEILERFESNAMAMKAYAQTQAIMIPTNYTKPETIAKRILEELNKAATDEEE